MTKTEDQIEKDKDAVASMRSAKANMESALRRVELLESRLKLVRAHCEVVAKAFGDNTYFRVVQSGNYVVRPAKDIFNDIDNSIKAVL